VKRSTGASAPHRGMGTSPGVAVVIGALAFLITLVWQGQASLSASREERRKQLASIVERRQERTQRYEEDLAELRARLDELAAASGAARLQKLRAETELIAAFSGATTVTGPGLVVELADSPDAGRDTLDPSERVQDVDLQAVVNALWAAGAEAIAVSGQRLVATSAIRNAGAAVLVNYKVLSSPYRVEAVGDPAVLQERFSASEVAAHFRRWVEIYGLGFSVAGDDALAIPAFSGSLRFEYARPIEDP